MCEVGVLGYDEEDGGTSAHKSGLERWLGYRFVRAASHTISTIRPQLLDNTANPQQPSR